MHLINYSWKTWIINAVGRLQTPQLQTDIKTLNLVRFSWFFFSNRSELSVEFRFGLHFANQKQKISEKWIFLQSIRKPRGWGLKSPKLYVYVLLQIIGGGYKWNFLPAVFQNTNWLVISHKKAITVKFEGRNPPVHSVWRHLSWFSTFFLPDPMYRGVPVIWFNCNWPFLD